MPLTLNIRRVSTPGGPTRWQRMPTYTVIGWNQTRGDGSAIDAEKHVLLGTRKWQSNGHSRALVRGTLRPDSPAVGIGDSLSDGQAQARTLR